MGRQRKAGMRQSDKEADRFQGDGFAAHVRSGHQQDMLVFVQFIGIRHCLCRIKQRMNSVLHDKAPDRRRDQRNAAIMGKHPSGFGKGGIEDFSSFKIGHQGMRAVFNRS